jgi:hypothetical protein
MPKLRDQMLKFLDDPDAAIRANTSAGLQPGLDGLAASLRVGGLYWVAPDMAALAVSSGGQLAAARWATADRPSPCGLILFDGGIGHIDSGSVSIPIEAMAWGPHDGDCMIWLMLSRRRLAAEMTRTDVTLQEEKIPPLIPVYGFAAPVTAEPVSMAELDTVDAPLTVVAALASAWLLMQQPVLVDRTMERPDKSTLRAYRRAGRQDPDVTVMDLRRKYVPQDRDPDAGSGRHYKHRWIVSGHWRNQPYGPGQSLRRQTWVPSHVKGPEGAPLLSTEKVNVWRR